MHTKCGLGVNIHYLAPYVADCGQNLILDTLFSICWPKIQRYAWIQETLTFDQHMSPIGAISWPKITNFGTKEFWPLHASTVGPRLWIQSYVDFWPLSGTLRGRLWPKLENMSGTY